MEKLKQEEEKLKKAENTIAVMTMLKEGTVPETVATAGENYRLYLWLCCSRFNIFADRSVFEFEMPHAILLVKRLSQTIPREQKEDAEKFTAFVMLSCHHGLGHGLLHILSTSNKH